MRLLIVVICLCLTGCSTVAKRSDGETLTLRGSGKAVWPDGASIENKPFQFPPLPPIKI